MTLRVPPTVFVRLPGPPEDGDPLGFRWYEPGVVSPGEVEVEFPCLDIDVSGYATIVVDRNSRRIPPSKWRHRGILDTTRREQLLSVISSVADGGSPAVKLIADTVRAIVENDRILDNVTNVVNAITRPTATDNEKILVILTLGLVWTSEVRT